MPEPGFFISDLVESVLGGHWSPLLRARLWAERWLSDQVLAPSSLAAIRAELRAARPFPHVVLRPALRPEVADQIAEALEQTPFRPHHHADYRLNVARQAHPGALGDFTRFLHSRAAGFVHAWMVGAPLVSISELQVQVSRMAAGEHFPAHHDTHEDGLAVVYNFTRDWREGEGGVLRFTLPNGGRLDIPPLFNSAIVFVPKDAPHEVTPVQRPEGRHRYSVTAFYLGTFDRQTRPSGTD